MKQKGKLNIAYLLASSLMDVNVPYICMVFGLGLFRHKKVGHIIRFSGILNYKRPQTKILKVS